MWKNAVQSIVIVGFEVCCFSAAVSAAQKDVSQQSGHAGNDFINYLWPLLNSANKVGRIYYTVPCDKDVGSPVPLPRIEARPPSNKKIGLAGVRDMLRGDQNIAVSEDVSGIIRITVGKVPDDILRTEISHVALTMTDRYNPVFAISAIEGTKEVMEKMREFNIHLPLIPYATLVEPPIKGMPHISAPLSKVSMDQALDVVATSFKGVVLYGVCSNSNIFQVQLLQP